MKRKNMHLGAKPSLFKNAYALRANPTPAEELLWQYLRNNQIEGVRFRRQHPLKNYVADFYAHEVKLIIELDGQYHLDSVQQFADHDRDQNLEMEDAHILRFENDMVMHHIEIVLDKIRNTILFLRKKKEQKNQNARD